MTNDDGRKPEGAPERGAVGGVMAATEDRAMTELVTQDRAPEARQGPHGGRRPPTVWRRIFGMTRQNVARLAAEAVIEQRSDRCYDQTASRLR